MKQHPIQLAAGISMCFATAYPAWSAPPNELHLLPSMVSRQITNGYSQHLYAQGCAGVLNGANTCGSIFSYDLLNVADPNSPTGTAITDAYVGLNEHIDGGAFNGSYRVLMCSVGHSDFTKFNSDGSRAFFEITVDASSPKCSTYGGMFNSEDGTFVEWGFSGITTIKAQFQNPRFPYRELSAGSISDKQLNTTHRYVCDLTGGRKAAGTFSFDGHVFVTLNTGEQNDWNTPYADFDYQKCRDAQVTK